MGGLLRGTAWVGLSIVKLGFSLGFASVGKDNRGRSGCWDAGDASELEVGCVFGGGCGDGDGVSRRGCVVIILGLSLMFGSKRVDRVLRPPPRPKELVRAVFGGRPGLRLSLMGLVGVMVSTCGLVLGRGDGGGELSVGMLFEPVGKDRNNKY